MSSPLREKAETQTAPAGSEKERGEPPYWRVDEICGPGGEARIDLDGDVYRLRITARRRLILTK